MFSWERWRERSQSPITTDFDSTLMSSRCTQQRRGRRRRRRRFLVSRVKGGGRQEREERGELKGELFVCRSGGL